MRLRHDPIEDDPELGPIVRKAGERAERELGASEGQMGFCHLLWERQQRILRDEYGIEWKSPSEMNPDILFD
jgi:hypothetical protein